MTSIKSKNSNISTNNFLEAVDTESIKSKNNTINSMEKYAKPVTDLTKFQSTIINSKKIEEEKEPEKKTIKQLQSKLKCTPSREEGNFTLGYYYFK